MKRRPQHVVHPPLDFDDSSGMTETRAPGPSPDPRIPVTLLTGFLGSGKTTILNHLVGQTEMSDALVIINEFGQIGLDHMLVAQSEDSATVRLDNGCICCTIRSDLLRTLNDLPWRFSRNGQRQFSRVLIETTGLADPAPIINTLVNGSALTGKYRLQSVVTAVDAVSGLETLDDHPQAVKQVALADCLIITKTDQFAALAAGKPLATRLTQLNPQALRYRIRHGQADPAWFAAAAQTRPDVVVEAPAVGHGSDISALCLTPVAGQSLAVWADWQAALIERLGDDLFRLKGLVFVDATHRAQILQSVQHIVMPPASPVTSPGEGNGQIVLIGRDLSWERLGQPRSGGSLVMPATSVQQDQAPDQNRQHNRHQHG